MPKDKKITKKRNPVDYASNLYIGNEMKAFDLKDRKFYDILSDEEKKKFSPFLMLKWGASIIGDSMLEQYYLMSVNEHVNKHFFDLSKHPKLQWLSCTTASPGLGKQKHTWIAGKGQNDKTSKLRKQLLNMLPAVKESDIDVIINTQSEEDILLWIQQHGISEKDSKSLITK